MSGSAAFDNDCACASSSSSLPKNTRYARISALSGTCVRKQWSTKNERLRFANLLLLSTNFFSFYVTFYFFDWG
jgi:hypothetical protein